MATKVSNKCRYLGFTKTIDFANDAFQIILMQSGFVFSETDHETYADVSAEELGTANGYTVGGETLSGVAVTEDDITKRANVTWNNVTWTATGGALTGSGAIIFDDTVGSPADPVVGYIDFGGTQSIADGGAFTLANIKLEAI